MQIVDTQSEGMTGAWLKETWKNSENIFRCQTMRQSFSKYGWHIYLALAVATENCFQMSSSLTSEPQWITIAKSWPRSQENSPNLCRRKFLLGFLWVCWWGKCWVLRKTKNMCTIGVIYGLLFTLYNVHKYGVILGKWKWSLWYQKHRWRKKK